MAKLYIITPINNNYLTHFSLYGLVKIEPRHTVCDKAHVRLTGEAEGERRVPSFTSIP